MKKIKVFVISQMFIEIFRRLYYRLFGTNDMSWANVDIKHITTSTFFESNLNIFK